MIVEFGHYALVLAFALTLVQSVLPIWGALQKDERLMAVAPPVSVMLFLLVLLSFVVLTGAYLNSDFSVLNVVENSHSAKPLLYKFTGVWGNHEGSMLLWVLILVFFGALVGVFGGNLPADLRAVTLSVQGWVTAGFVLFLLATSNPFTRIANPPLEGSDLNPILQDIGLAIHPPLLYVGYVGFSITFSFAVAALILGRIDAAGHDGCGPGHCLPGAFSRSASRWAPTGHTTNLAGVAGGSGIRSKMPASCPGLRARLCCTRQSSWKSARR